MDIIQFILLGLGTGALYALGAQGLVVIYRGSGVINFSHGAMALLGAALFAELNQDVQLPFIVSFVIAIAVTACVGLVIDQLIMRRLRNASPLGRLVVTLGVLGILESLVIVRYGSGLRFVEGFLPNQQLVFFDSLNLGLDRLTLLVIAIALTAGLWWLYRNSDFGRQTTAVSENIRSASAMGISANRVSAINWMLGAALAALTGILLAPVTGLMPSTMVLLINPLLAAALVGGFRSFPLTLLGGVLIGLAQGLMGAFDSGTGWSASVPFLVIIVTLVLRGKSLPMRGYLSDKLPAVGASKTFGWPIFGLILLTVIAIFFVPEELVYAITGSLLAATVLLSIVTVTGLAGQVSLAQYALAGVGAFVSARLAAVYGVSFPLAFIAALLVSIAVGALFALPALRTRGVNLAIVTLGLGLAVDGLVFKNIAYTGGYAGTQIIPPELFGISLDGIVYPRRYALVALVGFSVCAWLLNNIRQGVSGRRLLATRSNERAASALGVNVVGAKLYAFAVGAAFAATGGVLTAFRYPNVRFDAGFSPFESIPALLMTFLGGIGFIGGALIGGLLSVGGVINELLAHVVDLKEWQGLFIGVGAIAVVIAHPNGLAEALFAKLRSFKKSSQKPLRKVLDHSDEDFNVAPNSLIIKSLSVRFGGLVALDNVSLQVNPGEVVGLIGPNGAGKTTLIDAVSGVTQSQGELALGTKALQGLKPLARARSGLGRSFQSLELFDDLTVADNLRVAADGRNNHYFLTELIRPHKQTLPPQLNSLLKRCGLNELLDYYPHQLSFGQRRLLALARAVAAKPSIIMLDEPAAGLDSQESHELSGIIRWLADDLGMGVLLIEHDMSLLMSVSDRVAVLDFGHLIAMGSVDEVRENPKVIEAYLGSGVAND